MLRFDKIRALFPDVACILQQADFTSDSDLRTLDPTDLHELFPGDENRHKRHFLLSGGADGSTRTISEDALMRKIKEVRPEATSVLKEVPPANWHLLDRGDLLELFPGVDKLQWRKQIFEIIHPAQTSGIVSNYHKDKNPFPGKMASLTKREVKYQTLKTGEPLEVYANVIKKVSSKMQTRFVDAPGDHKVSILFCPVISRIGSDAETALATIKDDKPVILVFLIHCLKPQAFPLTVSWEEPPNIVLRACLFYHETKGLHSYKGNTTAISTIQEKLLEYSVPT